MKYEDFKHHLPNWAKEYGERTNIVEGWSPRDVYEYSNTLSVEKLSRTRPTTRWMLLGVSIGAALIFTLFDMWEWKGAKISISIIVMFGLGMISLLAIITDSANYENNSKEVVRLIATLKAHKLYDNLNEEKIKALKTHRDWLVEWDKAQIKELTIRRPRWWHELKIEKNLENTEINFYDHFLQEIASKISIQAKVDQEYLRREKSSSLKK